MQTHKRNLSSHYFTAIFLVALGLFFLAMNFGYIENYSWGELWPVFIILIGVSKLFDARKAHHFGSALQTILIGAWLLITTLHVWGLTFHTSWPILLVIVGINMIWKSFYRDSQMYC